MLPINSIEHGIIGEGSWIGSAAVIITFQGCEVGCEYCNARHTWDQEVALLVDASEVVRKEEKTTPTWALMPLEDIVDRVRQILPAPGIVYITGGEPLAYELHKLCKVLLDGGYQVAIETSGIHEWTLPQPVWVCVSPKFRNKTSEAVKSNCLQKADEIRMLVSCPQDIKDLELAMEWINPDVQEVYLQPESGNQEMFELCGAVCLMKDWKLSVQLPSLLAR